LEKKYLARPFENRSFFNVSVLLCSPKEACLYCLADLQRHFKAASSLIPEWFAFYLRTISPNKKRNKIKTPVDNQEINGKKMLHLNNFVRIKLN